MTKRDGCPITSGITRTLSFSMRLAALAVGKNCNRVNIRNDKLRKLVFDKESNLNTFCICRGYFVTLGKYTKRVHQHLPPMSEIAKPQKPNKPKTFKRRLFDFFAVLYMIFYVAIMILPTLAAFTVLYLITKWWFLLLCIIILIIAYIWMTIHGIIEFFKPYDPTEQPIFPATGDSGDSDEAAKAAGLILGAGLLGHHIGKHHGSDSDRVTDDWLWQEKYREHDT